MEGESGLSNGRQNLIDAEENERNPARDEEQNNN